MMTVHDISNQLEQTLGLTKRQLKMCYVYFETSHGKSKLDGLGGAIK